VPPGNGLDLLPSFSVHFLSTLRAYYAPGTAAVAEVWSLSPITWGVRDKGEEPDRKQLHKQSSK
jgi:hypothetical protein